MRVQGGERKAAPGPETLERLFSGKHGRETVRAERPRWGTAKWRGGLHDSSVGLDWRGAQGHMPHGKPGLLVLGCLLRPHRHPHLRNNHLDHTERKYYQCSLTLVKVPTESTQV